MWRSTLLLAGCGGSIAVPDGQRCHIDGDDRACTFETIRRSPGTLSTRDVHIEVPLGDPPDGGWPVVILFQGSLNSAQGSWSAHRDDRHGGWWQTGVIEALLAADFAVIAPETQGGGITWWNTNVLPWSAAWESAPDHQLMEDLFEGIEDGDFGELDIDRLHAAGISSGGYMTSRMALSYPGRFQSLAIQSGSWATCGGLLCVLPGELPDDHPPTLFLHGDRDDVVPVGTMYRYADRLAERGDAVRVVTDLGAGHAWIEAAPDEVVGWFVR